MQKPLSPRLARGASAFACFTLLAAPGASQQNSGPIARYAMDAGTLSGMAAMTGGGMGGGMGMMFGGGGNQPVHELVLRLGSTQTPGGAPQADHYLPAGVRLGASVPLVTPKVTPSENTAPPGETPKGRLLIYWGCGAAAGPNQPVVIDFAKVAKGQFPPGLYMNNAAIPQEWQVRFANSRTYGEWPNGQTRKLVPANASLIGDHRVSGNYSPEIKFALTQDFMPPVTGRARPVAGGATEISWNAVPKATGYYAWVFSAKEGGGDMVWWASSATQAFGGPVWDWLSPGAVQSLIGKKIVMPPTQTSCTVPAQVAQSGGQFMMGNLYAYGPEANFAFPPRPADPRIAWKPQWIARVRYRANSMWMLNGPDMGAMMGRAGNVEDNGDAASQPRKKKKCGGGLGGMLAGAMGAGC